MHRRSSPSSWLHPPRAAEPGVRCTPRMVIHAAELLVVELDSVDAELRHIPSPSLRPTLRKIHPQGASERLKLNCQVLRARTKLSETHEELDEPMYGLAFMTLHNQTVGRDAASRPFGPAAKPPQGSRLLRRPMAGMFELFVDVESSFRFRLTTPDGTVMAISKAFDTKAAAVAGIADVREYAGMGHITDLCPPVRKAPPPDLHDDPGAQTLEVRRIPAADLHAPARAIRQPAHRPRWAGVV